MYDSTVSSIQRHFVESLAYHPNAGNRKTYFHTTPAAEAVQMRYLSPDRPHEIGWLKLDIDDCGSGDHTAARWLDVGAPQPHFIIRNRHNRGSHQVYGLALPVLRGSLSRTAPRKLFEAVSNGYTRWLEADAGYPGTGIKNPLHKAWATITHDGPLYTLGELLDALPERLRVAPEQGQQIGEGRNTDLFYRTRLWAYDNVHSASQSSNFVAWEAAVIHHAHGLNIYTPKLPRSEVLGVARSVARWTWKNADNFQKRDRPPAKRSKLYSWDRPTLTPEQAREAMSDGGQIGAAKTNAIRRNRTFDAITSAIGELAGQGVMNPSAAQIAARSGVSVRTVRAFRAGVRAVATSQGN